MAAAAPHNTERAVGGTGVSRRGRPLHQLAPSSRPGGQSQRIGSATSSPWRNHHVSRHHSHRHHVQRPLDALGIVSDEYEVVDNRDAFRFLDALIGSDPHFDPPAARPVAPSSKCPTGACITSSAAGPLGGERDRDAQPLERPDAEPVGHPGQVVGHTMLECAGRDRVGDCRCSSARLWPASPATSDRHSSRRPPTDNRAAARRCRHRQGRSLAASV